MAHFAVRCFCLLTLLFVADSSLAVTEIRTDSEDGDRIGRGESKILTNDNGTISIVGWETHDVEIAWVDGDGDYLNLRFITADGAEPLAVGRYDDSQRWVAGSPTVDIWGFNGGCNRTSGWFEIYEIEFGADGLVTKLALDALQYCQDEPRALRAQIRIDSDVAFDLGVHVRAGNDQHVAPGDSVTVGLTRAETTNGIVEAYSWRQVFGPPVALTGATTDTVSFIAPTTDAETEVVELEVEITDSAGDTATDRMSVVVSSIPDVQSRIQMTPADGSFLAHIGSMDVDIDPAYLLLERDYYGVSIEYFPPVGDSFVANISPPSDHDLSLGQYHRAFDTDFRARNKPGISFEWGAYGCRQEWGEFKILDIGFADNTAVTRLAVDATLLCPNTFDPQPVTFRLRFNSAVPIESEAPIADPGPNQVVHSGDLVQLDGNSSQNDTGEVQSVLWQQVSGPSVTLSDPTSFEPTFAAPDVDAGEGLTEFSLTLTNEFGRSDTESVQINVLGDEDPKSYIRLVVEPGYGHETVTGSWGIDILLDEDDGYMEQAPAYQYRVDFYLISIDVFRFEFRPDGGPLAPLVPLQPGLYEFAQMDRTGLPHMAVNGPFIGCSKTLGHFVVHEYEVDGGGFPTALAIDFVQSCDYGPPLKGTVRLNSTVPQDPPGVFASAGISIEAVPDQVVRLDAGGSYVGPSAGVTYEWEQVSGPNVVLSGSDSPQATFVAPGTAGTAVFRVTITTAEGLVDTALVSIELHGPGVPVTAIAWQSTDGEPLFQGGSRYYSDAEIFERVYSPASVRLQSVNSDSFDLNFDAPAGEVLEPGDYLGAHGYAAIPGFPGVDLSYNIYGCRDTLGWFRVHEIEGSPDGTEIQKLAIDFWRTCDYGDPPIFGSVRINSTIPLTTEDPLANAGQPVVVPGDREHQLSAFRSYSWDASITSYEWVQVSGPPATFVSPANIESPTIRLPVSTAPSEELEFELTVTNDRGKQASARTTVTILADDQPWDQFNMTLFSEATGEVLDVVEATPNDSHFVFTTGPDRVVVNISYRDRLIAFSLDSNAMPADLSEGMYVNDGMINSPFPFFDFFQYFVKVCDYDAVGWLHVLDVEYKPEPETIAFESNRSCREDVGVRMSARINSTRRIERGEIFLEVPEGGTAREGQTVEFADAVAYVEGEHADPVEWTTVSGPAPRFDTTYDGRTMYVAPPIAGNASSVLQLSVTSQDGTTRTGQTTMQFLENGVSDFPGNLITTTTATGTYRASGLPVAIESDHLVGLYALSPVEIDSPLEPEVAPFGIFDMYFDTDVGETILVTMHFPAAVDADAQWLAKPDGSFAWEEFPGFWEIAADRMSVSFELTDDFAIDKDFATNGKIRFTGGLGQNSAVSLPPPPPPPTPPPSSGGGGGGLFGLGELLLFASFLLLRRTRSTSPGQRGFTFLGS